MCGHVTSNRQWMIFICCHCCFTKQCVWFSTCCHCPLSKSSAFGFLRVFTAHLINSGRCSVCCHCCALSSVWGFPHVVTALFQTSMDAVFLVLSRHIYLLSTGWISTCYYCCFTKQWMWFSTCCHCPPSKNWVWFSVCFHCTLNKQWMVSIMFSVRSSRNQWIQFFLLCQGTFIRHWMDFHMLSLLFH